MILWFLCSCQAFVDFYGTESSQGDSGFETGLDTADDAPGPIEGVISGTVRVELYVESDEGVREYLSMEEAYGESYPFGPIFLTATTTNAEDLLDYHGSTVILEPNIDGDPYQIEVRGTDGEAITIYGAVDTDGDGTIHSSDPTGLHPAVLDFSESDSLGDIDISILVADDPELIGSGQPWEGGHDGGQGCKDLVISGPVEIERMGDGTRGVAMLADSTGAGPVDWVWFDAEAQGSGGVSEYSIPTCEDLGAYFLVGAFDTNGNEIIDPEDDWGGWSDEGDGELSPVDIGTEDLVDHLISIPLGDGRSPLDLVPFVQIGGTVSVQDGSFDDLSIGSRVYISALKYPPESDMTVGSMATLAYDMESVDWQELTGQSSISFRLGVPADTLVYLWAFADEDLDEIINESGERVASGGADDEGTFATGSSDSNQNLPLAHAEDR